MMLQRAVVYLRVSTDKQVEGTSLDTQEFLCQQWASNNKVVIDKIFHDDGYSAKSLNRPQLLDLISYVDKNKGRISYLLTYQTDRLSRNAADFFTLKIKLSQAGVEFKNVNSRVGENTAGDDLIQTMEAGLAQYDNRIKSDRVKDNMKQLAKEGYRMSKAPYGLRNIRDLLNKSTVEAIPGVSDKIALLLTQYSTGGYTIASLLKYAHEIGLVSKNGEPLKFQVISKMLRQPLYAGLENSTHTDRQLVQSKFKGLVTPAVYYRNQEILRKNKNTAANYKQINPLFPLRGFMSCSNCNKPLRGSSPTSANGKSYPRYHCTGCKVPSIATDELHEQFLYLMGSLVPTPEMNKYIRELITRVWQEEVAMLNKKEQKLHRLLEALRIKRRAAIDKVVSGELTGKEKDVFIAEIDEETEKINTNLEKVGAVTKLKTDAVDFVLRFMANAPHLWNNSSIDNQIIFQKLIFPKGISYNLKTNDFGTLHTSMIYSLANTKKLPAAAESFNMVNYLHSNWNLIMEELTDWYELRTTLTPVYA